MASRTPPSDVLAAWLARQRWFAGKSRRIAAVVLEDGVPLAGGTVWIARVALDDATVHRYALPLVDGAGGIVDALDDAGFCRALVGLIACSGRAPGGRGEIVAERTRAFPPALGAGARRLGGEQSNTSVVVGDALVVKHFRRLAPGVNPELEIGRFLTERTAFRHTPRLAGALEYRDAAGAWPLAVAQELVADAQDGWRWMLDRLDAGDPALDALHRLGARTGQLHAALASDAADPDFAPEPITGDDLAAWAAAIAGQVADARWAVRGRPLPDGGTAVAGVEALRGLVKTRHHGDFHLGQTLRTERDDDFAIIDFEGEPLRPLAQRRRKHSPLRDVAGMLRSLAYAAETAQAGGGGRRPRAAAWAAGWERQARAAFLEGYLTAARPAAFVPDDDARFARGVAAFELEKAAYEIVYEANNRPEWVEIPVRGFVRAAAAPVAAAGEA